MINDDAKEDFQVTKETAKYLYRFYQRRTEGLKGKYLEWFQNLETVAEMDK